MPAFVVLPSDEGEKFRSTALYFKRKDNRSLHEYGVSYDFKLTLRECGVGKETGVVWKGDDNTP